MQGSEFLPEYTLRVSKRAKRAQMTYTREHGLVVVLPENLSINVEKFIQQNITWINKQAKKRPLEQKKFNYPNTIELLCINRIYELEYMSFNKKCRILERPGNNLVIFGDLDKTVFCKILQKWLFNKAKEILLPMLDSISRQCSIPYKMAKIRNQNTIWGSCSEDKNISLNSKLILLPENLVRYILIHELCHIRYLNHSNDFWNLVHSYDANYLEHKKQLSIWQMKLPSWLSK